MYVVGLTETCQRLAFCPTEEAATAHIGTLPKHKDGIYYIDGPVRETIVVDQPRIPEFKGLPKPGSRKQAFLLHIAKVGVCTRAEANVALGLDEQGPTNPITDLISEGLVCDTGEYRESSCGVNARLVRLTERGRLELKLVPTKWYPNRERVL